MDTPSSVATLNVGRLGAAHPMPIGPAVRIALVTLACDLVELMRGFHYGELCDAESPVAVADPGLADRYSPSSGRHPWSRTRSPSCGYPSPVPKVPLPGISK
ncbi:hypothetical protein HD601_004231 [Jiangella mangrovi]|uniref:Uncharacterized protein n=1 Tax=Jiangella mangrovi TaxID=1524084 RepID=A0A7W9LMV8_9ACTN|nr:hypothetical protein [Jiangella mangrovi]